VSLRDDDAGIEMRLPATNWSPRVARRFVAARLNESLSGQDIVGTAALVTSELVTNAVQHTSASVRVRVERLADHVRVEVSDRSSPRQNDADHLGLSNGGPPLIGRLCDRWGVAESNGERSVWCTIRLA
jgi:anti-sigma regulatory factor (Ser/Thr protein kinase)